MPMELDILEQETCDAPQLSIENSPLHLLHRVNQIADTLLHTAMSDLGITPRQFAILSAVAMSGSPSQVELTEHTGIDRSTMADVVKRLMDKGLLRRKRTKDDARMYAVTLSEQGVKTLNAARKFAVDVENELLSVIPGNRAAGFVDSLRIIIGKYADH